MWLKCFGVTKYVNPGNNVPSESKQYLLSSFENDTTNKEHTTSDDKKSDDQKSSDRRKNNIALEQRKKPGEIREKQTRWTNGT